jgi:RNA polymerase sigma-70 factor (ECF subfamily)
MPRDVVQETMVGVVKQMPEFEYNRAAGRFKNWLLTIASRRIIDHLRRQGRRVAEADGVFDSSDTRTPLIQKLPDPAGLDLDRVWDEEWRKNLADVAIERVKQKVKPKMFQIFDCYVLRGWPVTRVTTKLRVNRGQVYFAKYRIGAMLRAESRRLEKEWG